MAQAAIFLYSVCSGVLGKFRDLGLCGLGIGREKRDSTHSYFSLGSSCGPALAATSP